LQAPFGCWRQFGLTKTSRQEFTVKFSGMIDHAGKAAGDTGHQPENKAVAALGL
jgi:hypothetical protein